MSITSFSEVEIEHIVNAELGTLLWSEHRVDVEGQDMGSYDADYDYWDATPELRADLEEELAGEWFVIGNDAPRFAAALKEYKERFGDEWPNQFGHDMALTRNHHGAGFWDRGLGDAGRDLTTWVQTFSELHVFDEFSADKADAWAGKFHAE